MGIDWREADWEKCVLALLVSDSPMGLQTTLLYSSHAIGDPIATAAAECVSRAATAIMEERPVTVAALDLFGALSWSQVQRWNIDLPSRVEACMHEMIDDTARNSPENMALACWDGTVTYSQLADYTSRLGNYLISHNIGPGVFVPLCFDKSLWAVVSMLGVQKAGGAFVCIDPAQPIDRLKTIIEEAEAQLVLCAPEYHAMNAASVSTVVSIDADFVKNLPQCPDLPRRSIPSAPAFAIFTSGSTGKPKGIVHEHRAMCSSARAHAAKLNMDQNTRSFQFAAYTFIVNTFELFTPLTVGGCVCVPSKEDRLGRTTGAMRDLNANWACLTPSFLRSLSPEELPQLKTLVLAGEPVQQDNLDTWRHRVTMLNMYGASEASLCVTGNLSEPVERSTIGKGAGCATWVVDANNQNRLAPVGAIGELAVEGPILAREYLNHPGRTAASFISATPWLRHMRNGHPSRAYKTGDLVRYGSDGKLNLVGRKDMQIKLRGQRIEIEEVEFHVRQSVPRGTEIAVGLVKPSDQPNRPFLAVFAALKKTFGDGFYPAPADEAAKLDAAMDGWKERLQKVVPGYMVPSTLVKLRHIPLTPSGKTNRKALDDLTASLTFAEIMGAPANREHRAPATATGRVLRSLWAAALEAPEDSISADDSFLQLGGSSIEAMKLVNLAREQGIKLSVADIFTHPLLDDMAEASVPLTAQKEFQNVPFALVPQLEGELDDLIESAASQCGVSKQAIEDLYPCTAMQEGLMALTDSRSGAYIAYHTLSLGPKVNLARFKHACEEVVATHPILRTRIFYPEGSGALQAVLRGPIHWQASDSLENYMKEDKQRSMRSGDALTRYGLVPDASSSTWTFVWTVHHAVYDAWTLDLMFERLEAAYKGTAPALDNTFKEFMTAVVSTEEASARSFWTQYLAGATKNQFPSAVTAASQPTADAALSHTVKLPREQLVGITTATILRAAWGILIGAHSESEDVVFGGIVSGRNTPIPNADKLFGPGIAAVPVRITNPGGKIALGDFLGKVQSDSTRMIPYEQTGLQHINRMSPDAASACDFQTLLVIQPDKGERVPADPEEDLRAVSDPDTNFGTYALSLECTLRADSVRCNAHYDSRLVSEDRVQRILYQLEGLVQQMSSSPASKQVRELKLISEYDEATIREWNKYIVPPLHSTIQELVQKQIDRRSNHEAVYAWDGSFTYGELDYHADRLAYRLRALGARPDTYIPAVFEKSRWAMVAMLGILRSGAAFFNVDPILPVPRLQLMFGKLKSTIIVCSTAQEALCQGLSDNRNLVVLDEESPSPMEEPEVALPESVDPECPAYVIFTSGSTGEPKGTIIPQGAFATAALSHGPDMKMSENARALQFASWTFDASIIEALTTLIVGGCVCEPSEDQRKRDITEFMRAAEVNWAALTPSYANLINPDSVPNLETLCLAGEAMSQSHIDTWGERVRLINGYGPSECCVAAVIKNDVTPGTSPRNIGFGCSGICWVVMPDDHTKLAPIGSVGELVLEGWNTGKGYLNEPEKTAAAFIRNPMYFDLPGQTRPPTVYKTGDLVIYNADGSVDFQRRKDTQVKLRGQRVELGEIEYQIKQALPDKPDAVVDILAPSDAPDQPRLVAFIPIPGEQQYTTPSEPSLMLDALSDRHIEAVSGLEDRLAKPLPMHMIPGVFLPVLYIPQMPSGKADRKALKTCGSKLTQRQMAECSGASQEHARPPTTETQLAMQQLWAEALKMPAAQIHLNDNFMRLGGDSIVAMRMASAARARGFPMSTATVFQYPTLEAMSAVAGDAQREQAEQEQNGQTLSFAPFSTMHAIMPKQKLLDEVVLPQVGVPASEVEDVLQPTDFQSLAINGGLGQTRGWSNYLVFDFEGPIDLRRLHRACERLLANHAILRTVFVKMPGPHGQLLQVVLRASMPEYTLHIQDDDDDPTEKLVRQDLARTPRLGQPILRFMLVKNGATRHRLVMRVSHGQYDGASMPLIMQDLRAGYRDQPMPTRRQFPDFVRMQLYSTRGAADFYRQMLAGSSMTPVVAPRTPSGGGPNVLDTMLSESLPLVAFKKHGITAATVIKAAWALVLAQMSGTSDVVYGHMVSGRNLPLDGVETIMGPCLNIVPVRAQLQSTGTVLALLQAIQQQQTDTIPHESMGFREIIDTCTEWPAGTRFSSVFQHQEFGAGEEDVTPGQMLPVEGVLKCAPGFICPAPDACDLSILATPVVKMDIVRVDMIYSSQAMARGFVEATMKRLASMVDFIAADVDAAINPRDLCSQVPQIPLTLPELSGLSNGVIAQDEPESNGQFVSQMVNGLNDAASSSSSGVNAVYEEETDRPESKVNLMASVSMN